MNLEEELENIKKDRNFLDNWFPKGIAGWRASHALTHPWLILEYLRLECKYAWQRVFSFDERIVWSIDFHLAKQMPLWVKQLKKDSHGVPCSFFEEGDWDDEKCDYKDGAMERASAKHFAALDQIIEGFSAYYRLRAEGIYPRNPEYQELDDKYKLGMKAFVDNFESLWD
jgi:hypothetical protein